MSLTSQMVIFSKVVVLTSQPVDTQALGTFDRPRKQASAKADLSTFGSGVLVIN